jgi:hypothetical protein
MPYGESRNFIELSTRADCRFGHATGPRPVRVRFVHSRRCPSSPSNLSRLEYMLWILQLSLRTLGPTPAPPTQAGLDMFVVPSDPASRFADQLPSVFILSSSLRTTCILLHPPSCRIEVPAPPAFTRSSAVALTPPSNSSRPMSTTTRFPTLAITSSRIVWPIKLMYGRCRLWEACFQQDSEPSWTSRVAEPSADGLLSQLRLHHVQSAILLWR